MTASLGNRPEEEWVVTSLAVASPQCTACLHSPSSPGPLSSRLLSSVLKSYPLFPGPKSVLVLQGSHNKTLPSKCLEEREMHCLTFPEPASPESSCRQEHAASEDSREEPPLPLSASDGCRESLGFLACSFIIPVPASVLGGLSSNRMFPNFLFTFGCAPHDTQDLSSLTRG